MELLLDDENLEAKICSLLDDIAATRERLACAIEDSRSERNRLQESHSRLKQTYTIICQNADFGVHNPRPYRKPASTAELDRLTSRELEVLRLIAQGFSTKQIAEKLKISFKTAVCHRSHILAKLKCHESATLVRIAMQSGLVA